MVFVNAFSVFVAFAFCAAEHTATGDVIAGAAAMTTTVATVTTHAARMELRRRGDPTRE
jgi:hypothetical protein